MVSPYRRFEADLGSSPTLIALSWPRYRGLGQGGDEPGVGKLGSGTVGPNGPTHSSLSLLPL